MIGERIRSLLEAQQKKPADLAEWCEVTVQAVHLWLNGAEPKTSRREQIAAFFNITAQELEYAPLLSLTVTRTTNTATSTSSEQVAAVMIASATSNVARSPEYKKGMRDRIVSSLTKLPIASSFSIGTCQADAYIAGCEHADRLLNSDSEITSH